MLGKRSAPTAGRNSIVSRAMRRGVSRTVATERGRPGWVWALSFLVLGFALGLVLFAPAAWLAAAVRQMSEGRVLLEAPRGTVWSGSAELVLAAGPGSQGAARLPGRMQWQLAPTAAGLQARLDAACCTSAPLLVAMSLRWRGAQWVMTVPQSRWPLALLAGLGTPFNTLGLQGTLGLESERFELVQIEGRRTTGGQLVAQVDLLASRLATLQPLGKYRITFDGAQTSGGAAHVQLSTDSGALLLSGDGQWVGERLRFRGEAKAAPEHAAALSNLINIMTRREGGRAVITLG